MEIRGKVERENFGEGSKSDRSAIVINSDKGKFVLRRLGANPFSDPELDDYVGKTIRCTGNPTGYTFIASDLVEVKDDHNS